MKLLKLLMAFTAFSFILLTACKKDTDNIVVPKESQTKNKASARRSAEFAEKVSKLRASLPAGFEGRLKQKSDLLLKTHPEYRAMILKAMKVIEPTPCDGNTELFQWLNQELADWNEDVFYYAFVTNMLNIPTDYAFFFENSSSNQYFGVNGEYTQRMKKTFKDLQRFWNIQSDDIALVGIHGSMLGDRDKLITIYEAYGLESDAAEAYADLVIELLDVFPQYRDGDHPIFSFNAFAVEGFNFPPFGVIPDKIMMGDGIMEAYTAIGYGDVAPQAILAHEFGHQIQFQLGLFTDEYTPEATRRTELMADAYSAYYLSHARGASMQWKRVQQFLQVFFTIGDCAFDNPGHHGTPAQRMAAAEWAYNLANNAQKQGHILTAQQFVALFDAQLPQLVKSLL